MSTPVRLGAALTAAALLLPSACGAADVSNTLLANFESGVPAGTAALTTANSAASANSGSGFSVVSDAGSNRLKVTNPDGGTNGILIPFTAVIPSAGNYLVTAEIKVVNSAANPIESFGIGLAEGGATTAKISDANAGYVMNLYENRTTAAALGYQTVGAALEFSGAGSFPRNITVYLSTDPSRGSDSTLPANDGNHNGGHRTLATTWNGSTTEYVLVDNIRLIGPGNKGEDRHLWISVGDGYTNLATLENQLVAAKNNNFNAVDILARYRANRYYRANRDFATYANPEPFASGASAANDPIQYAIDRGHELGLKVYVSFSCFLTTDGGSTYPSYLPSGSVNWVYNAGSPRAQTVADIPEGLWADVGRKDLRDYTTTVALDLVQNYDIDGIIFDRIRYEGTNCGYNPMALSEMGIPGVPATTDANFSDKRRDAVTTFLNQCYENMTTIKPWIVVGTVPIAYMDDLGDTYNSVFQAWYKWSSKPTRNRAISFGCEDIIQPQFYRLSTSTPPYQAPAANESLMLRAQFGDVSAFSRDFGLMPGANVNCVPLFYHPNSADSAQSTANAQNMCDTRNSPTYFQNGFGLYAATRTLTDISLIRGASPTPCGADVLASAVAPSDFLMKKGYDKTPPSSITNLAADSSVPGCIKLTWSTPAAASDGEIPSRYLVYRSATTPVKLYYANLVNRNYDVTGNSFTDKAATGLTTGNKYYRVVPVDDYNNKANSNEVGPVTANLPEYVIESRTGGQHFADYQEISGDWANSSSKSTATNPAVSSSAIGSRYATLAAKNDVARFKPSGLPANVNTYRIYYTTNNVSSTDCTNCTYRVMTATGLVSGVFDMVPANTANTWYLVGEWNLDAATAYFEVDSSTSTGTNRIVADAVRFQFVAYVPAEVSSWEVY